MLDLICLPNFLFDLASNSNYGEEYTYFGLDHIQIMEKNIFLEVICQKFFENLKDCV